MAHGVKPLFPFDITMAMFLVPELTRPLSTTKLIAIRARQLEMHKDDLAAIRDNVLKSRLASVRQFEQQYENTIKLFDFKPGDLVLMRNSGPDSALGLKTKPRYFGPMVILRKTRNGAYRLVELDGTISKLRYAAFRLVPYFARSHSSIPVTRVIDHDDLTEVVQDFANDDPDPDAA